MDFTSGIKIANNSWSLYVNRGQCEYEMKLYEESKNDFTSAIHIYGDGPSYYMRAKAKLRLGDLTGAIHDKAAAIRIDGLNYLKTVNDSIPYQE